MSAAMDTTLAMTALHSAAVNAPHPTNDPVAAKKAATAFEGVFVTQFLGEMFSGISTDGPFGGGQGEEMFRSLMIDEYGKQIAAQGGFGLSDAVQRQLLKTQEIPH
jgi:Rod binding domain-containing protein